MTPVSNKSASDAKSTCTERGIVVSVLMDIFESGSYNNIALRKTLDENDALTSHQKAFITEVVNGVLRNNIYIDYIINNIASLNIMKMKPYIRNCLRSAVYQLRFLDNAKNFAVCNESVELVKRRNMGNLTGFVNGILRNILRVDIDNMLPCLQDKPVDFLSVKYSVPAWLVTMWVDCYGFERTKLMCEVNNKPPKVTVCVNTLKTDAKTLTEKLEEEGAVVTEGLLNSAALKVSKIPNISQLQPFLAGEFHVMDESAMAAVSALDVKPNDRMLDLCASPGGKSFYASYLMQNKGEIIANDIHSHKVALIEEGVRRLKTTAIKTSLSDAEVENPRFVDKFNKVLVDAPCTGYGVIRKKPDIKLDKNENTQKELSALQKSILTQAAKYVVKGGTLVYSTCTLTPDENEENAKWFSENFPFTLTEQKTIFPQDYDSDGFFIAVFKRNA